MFSCRTSFLIFHSLLSFYSYTGFWYLYYIYVYDSSFSNLISTFCIIFHFFPINIVEFFLGLQIVCMLLRLFLSRLLRSPFIFYPWISFSLRPSASRTAFFLTVSLLLLSASLQFKRSSTKCPGIIFVNFSPCNQYLKNYLGKHFKVSRVNMYHILVFQQNSLH